ncbi:hypothetical protein [Halomonas sp. YLGW01]|uniref:hypothetical protein n=1 Tax=Halomonas sp. YLGW01 TaxID=2773308 RepID=UPI001785B4FF|nr:hypothetical protein [Halomonas sp. YLGW01]
MMKRYAYLLAVGLILPNLAMGDTLRLPSEARIDVQVVDTLELDRTSPDRANVLLKPVVRQDDPPPLPAHCLITADARLVEDRMRLSANTLTCIEVMGDTREIFSGELSAAAFDANGDFGVNATCTASDERGCQRAELRPAHAFQLELGQALSIEAQDNPSARLNEQRRQAATADNGADAD